MSGFIAGADHRQATAFPELLDDYVDEESVNRVIDAFVDEMGLLSLGFKTNSADTGRPGYHPSTMLKLFIYDYMNRCNRVIDWMGPQHFKTKTLKRVSTEMSLHVLAYNLKRVIRLFSVAGLIEKMQTV